MARRYEQHIAKMLGFSQVGRLLNRCKAKRQQKSQQSWL
jgi:hypothetical protein